jgi:hypothetical protein
MRHDAEIRELLHKRRDEHTLPQAFYTDTDLFEFDLRDEDAQLIENNQCGVNSFGYEPGPYSSRAEWTVAVFADWYCTEADQYLSGSDGALSAAAQ